VQHNHTYLALQLLEKGASLTPEAGELLGLDNVLKVPSVLHSLVKAQNVRAIRWLVVRSESSVEVMLSRDKYGWAVQNGCAERLYRAVVQNGCTERLYRTVEFSLTIA
jgi:hypothetical protein